MRMGNSIPHHNEDHIAGKGENSLQQYNMVHKFIPVPQAMNIPWRSHNRGHVSDEIATDWAGVDDWISERKISG